MNNLSMQISSMVFGQSTSPGLTALIVLLLGMIVAVSIRIAASKILEAGKFNEMCDRVGFSEFLRKGNVSYSPARLAAVIAYWAALLAAVLWALRIMGIRPVVTLTNQFQAALPKYVAAVCIVAFGYILVAFLANVLRTIAKNAAVPYADLLARIVKWVGVFLVVFFAVGYLGVEFRLVSSALQIAWAAFMFGLALAFGLGCKDMARDAMQRFLHDLREKHRRSGGDLEG